ncbi:MAG: transglutaminase family protein [Burkholderiaceae bacterium]|nr:transglutaminase family protein [Burkholderiaceae bacterium]
MRFSIRHRTLYRYETPAQYSIQVLRLTPRDEPQQRTLRWTLRTPAPAAAARDAHGNLGHLLTLAQPHAAIDIEAYGEVEVQPLADGRLPERGTLPPLAYAIPTRLTAADDAIRALAARTLRAATPAALLEFAAAVREAIDYLPGATGVGSSAAEALALGRGVCQDHAHVFIAGCRAAGVPARYVSGYVHPGDAPHAASHAWADAWLEDLGWVSIDVTHGRFASDHLCRLAVGLDYDSACPVRGMRVGGGAESMQARVNIRALSLPAQGGPARDAEDAQ